MYYIIIIVIIIISITIYRLVPCAELIRAKVSCSSCFEWSSQLRYSMEIKPTLRMKKFIQTYNEKMELQVPRERSLRLPSDGMSTSLSRSAASSRTPISRPRIVSINGGTVCRRTVCRCTVCRRTLCRRTLCRRTVCRRTVCWRTVLCADYSMRLKCIWAYLLHANISNKVCDPWCFTVQLVITL